MKFIIERVSNMNDPECIGAVLLDEKYKMWTIELLTLYELIQLKNIVGKRLIISKVPKCRDEDREKLFKDAGIENVITIYDGNIE